jgi:uncharacterized protein
MAAASFSCARPQGDATSRKIRIITGDRNGNYHRVGQALAGLYMERTPGADVVVVPSSAQALTLRDVDEGTADVGFSNMGLAYRAYTRGWPDTTLRSRLRGMAVLYMSTYHFVVRADSRYHGMSDLEGARVGIVLTSTDPDARNIRFDWLQPAFGVPPDSLTIVRMTLGEIPEALRSRRIDCVVVPSGFPNSAIAEAAADVGIRLLTVDAHAAAIARAHQPFFKPILIPGNTYAGQTELVSTVGVENILLAHERLDEEIVYQLTKALFEALPQLAQQHPVLRQIDPERASATIIPLHPGAARYYREHQLAK